MTFELLAAAADAAPENSFGFLEAMEQGGFVAWFILGVMVIMSVGSFYILFTKLFEQRKVLAQSCKTQQHEDRKTKKHGYEQRNQIET